MAAQLFVNSTVIPFSPEQYQQVKAILNQLMDLPIDEQMAMANRLCDGNDELLARVKQMLDADQPDFMSSSALDVFALEERPVVPEVISQYHLGERMGSGGMGEVYLAQQKAPANRQVAIKLLKPLINQTQLEEECHVMAQLNHPNIATLYEVGHWSEGHLFIAMEYIDGDDIVQWCQNNQLSHHQRIRLFLQLCHGIAYAHEKGIIHCDIKPNNVMVTNIHDKPVVKIIDFGIAQGLDNPTENRHVSGTINYLAPEVLDKDSKPLADTRRDIYAMGVLLQKLLDDCVLTRDLQAIIDKATAMDPSMRYAAVHALVDDIHRFFDQNPVSARKATWAYTSGLFIKRRLGTVLFSLALLITVAGGYWFQRQQAILASDQALLAKQAQNEAEEMATFLTGLFDVANPEKGRETAVTAEELLHNAKDQLLAIEEPTLSDARFMHTVGSILIRMDQFNDAEYLIEQSLYVKRQDLEPNDDEVIAGLSQLGLIYRKTLKYPEAEQVLKETIALAKTQKPINQKQLAFAHNHLGNVYSRMRQLDLALEQHQAAMTLRTALDDKKHLADSYNNMAVIHRLRHNWEAAAKDMHRALAIYKEVYDLGHPFIAAIKHNLSYVEEQSQNWKQADLLLKEAVATWKIVYGFNHTNTLIGIENQVLYYQRRLRFEDTFPILEEVIAEMEKAQNVEKQAHFLSMLGKSYAHMGEEAKATSAHQWSLEVIKDTQTKDKNFMSRLLIRYAETLLQLEQYQAAESEVVKGLEQLKEGPAQQFLQMKGLNALAKAKWHLNDIEASKTTLNTIISQSANGSKRNQSQQILAMLALGQLHRLSRAVDKAEAQLDQALALSLEVHSPKHKITGLILAEKGMLYRDMNQHKQAVEILKQAHEIQVKSLPSGHPDLLTTSKALAAITAKNSP